MKRKPHIEFELVSNEEGWETPYGYPEGIKQKILASDLNEETKNWKQIEIIKI
jgi:hypothetical protein